VRSFGDDDHAAALRSVADQIMFFAAPALAAAAAAASSANSSGSNTGTYNTPRTVEPVQHNEDEDDAPHPLAIFNTIERRLRREAKARKKAAALHAEHKRAESTFSIGSTGSGPGSQLTAASGSAAAASPNPLAGRPTLERWRTAPLSSSRAVAGGGRGFGVDRFSEAMKQFGGAAPQSASGSGSGAGAGAGAHTEVQYEEEDGREDSEGELWSSTVSLVRKVEEQDDIHSHTATQSGVPEIEITLRPRSSLTVRPATTEAPLSAAATSAVAADKIVADCAKCKKQLAKSAVYVGFCFLSSLSLLLHADVCCALCSVACCVSNTCFYIQSKPAYTRYIACWPLLSAYLSNSLFNECRRRKRCGKAFAPFTPIRTLHSRANTLCGASSSTLLFTKAPSVCAPPVSEVVHSLHVWFESTKVDSFVFVMFAAVMSLPVLTGPNTAVLSAFEKLSLLTHCITSEELSDTESEQAARTAIGLEADDAYAHRYSKRYQSERDAAQSTGFHGIFIPPPAASNYQPASATPTARPQARPSSARYRTHSHKPQHQPPQPHPQQHTAAAASNQNRLMYPPAPTAPNRPATAPARRARLQSTTASGGGGLPAAIDADLYVSAGAAARKKPSHRSRSVSPAFGSRSDSEASATSESEFEQEEDDTLSRGSRSHSRAGHTASQSRSHTPSQALYAPAPPPSTHARSGSAGLSRTDMARAAAANSPAPPSARYDLCLFSL
jgi:hypothetical protein